MHSNQHLLSIIPEINEEESITLENILPTCITVNDNNKIESGFVKNNLFAVKTIPPIKQLRQQYQNIYNNNFNVDNFKTSPIEPMISSKNYNNYKLTVIPNIDLSKRYHYKSVSKIYLFPKKSNVLSTKYKLNNYSNNINLKSTNNFQKEYCFISPNYQTKNMLTKTKNNDTIKKKNIIKLNSETDQLQTCSNEHIFNFTKTEGKTKSKNDCLNDNIKKKSKTIFLSPCLINNKSSLYSSLKIKSFNEKAVNTLPTSCFKPKYRIVKNFKYKKYRKISANLKTEKYKTSIKQFRNAYIRQSNILKKLKNYKTNNPNYKKFVKSQNINFPNNFIAIKKPLVNILISSTQSIKVKIENVS